MSLPLFFKEERLRGFFFSKTTHCQRLNDLRSRSREPSYLSVDLDVKQHVNLCACFFSWKGLIQKEPRKYSLLTAYIPLKRPISVRIHVLPLASLPCSRPVPETFNCNCKPLYLRCLPILVVKLWLLKVKLAAQKFLPFLARKKTSSPTRILTPPPYFK